MLVFHLDETSPAFKLLWICTILCLDFRYLPVKALFLPLGLDEIGMLNCGVPDVGEREHTGR